MELTINMMNFIQSKEKLMENLDPECLSSWDKAGRFMEILFIVEYVF